MDREEFYNKIKEWEKERKKYIFALFSYIGLIFLAMKYIDTIFPFTIQTHLQAALIIMALSVPACVILYFTEKLNFKYELACSKCKTQFDRYNYLMQVGFTNQCPKCGTNVYSV